MIFTKVSTEVWIQYASVAHFEGSEMVLIVVKGTWGILSQKFLGF